jgi:eukaryotic-like serine/threonine-protein kinase
MPTCPVCRTRYDEPATSCAKDGASLLPDQAFVAAETPLAIGTQVGEYRVEGVLGDGAFGTVYAATHPLIGKRAAIKVLRRRYSADPEVVSRFLSEARAVNQIRHRNIIDIFAFGVLDDGRHYYVMELLEGTTLDAYLRTYGRLKPSQALPILRQLARALAGAHQAGIAHRDLKPENVFLTFDDDGQPIPKLLDFGIAKLLGEGSAQHKTQSGAQMGTPYYMSPEQIHGRDVDTRADVYSFGVMTFELLTGDTPYDGESAMDLMMGHLSAPVPAMSDRCADLPAEFDEPVRRMMAKDASDRPSSIVEAIDALIQVANRLGVVGTSGPHASIPHAALSSPGAGWAGVPSSGVVARTGDADVDESGKTIAVGEPSRTLHGSAASIPTKRPRPVALYAVLGLVALAAASLLVIRLGASSVPTPGSTTLPGAPVPPKAPQPQDTATVAPIVEPATSDVVPSASASAPALPAHVELRLKVVPRGAEVYLGSRSLGTADEPLELERSDRPMTLEIRKAGHASKKLEIVPDRDLAEAVILQPLQVQPKKDYSWD